MPLGSNHASPVLHFITFVRHQSSTAYEIFFNFHLFNKQKEKISAEFSVDSEICSTFTLKVYYLEPLSVHFSVGTHFLGCFRVFMFIYFTPFELIGPFFCWHVSISSLSSDGRVSFRLFPFFSDGEGLDPEFKCLFCTLTWRSAGDLSRQCSSIHSFDFYDVGKLFGFDFYSSFKLVNSINSQARNFVYLVYQFLLLF